MESMEIGRKVIRSSEREVHIEIPSYPDEAEAIYSEFRESIGKTIGADNATVVAMMDRTLALVHAGAARLARRTYTVRPTDDGRFEIEETQHENATSSGGGKYTTPEIPADLRHLFRSAELETLPDVPEPSLQPENDGR
jgi:hypothetical protein